MTPARTPRESKLVLKRRLAATPAKVYAAWTKPALMRRWFAPPPVKTLAVTADVRVGGRYSITMQPPSGAPVKVSGTYVEVVAGRRLVFTWGWEGEPWAETLVTIALKPVALKAAGRATEITLTHQRFQSPEARDKHTTGWTGCLASLEAYLVK